MKASLIAKALLKIFKTRRSCFIWGPPGVGKSHVVAQVAKEMKCRFYDIRATQLDPVDLRGVPKVVTINSTPRTIWALPNLLPTKEDLVGYEGAVVFFDELNAAPPSMQATFYQIIQDRKCGDYIAPDNVFFVAAGNRETDRAVVNRMPTPLANKFIHLDFEVDAEELIAYAIKQSWSPFIIAWLRFRPALVYNFDPQSSSKQFASPRTYEFASDLLADGLESDVEFELLKGTLGEGVATELIGFLKICRNLPDPDYIIKNPHTAQVPQRDPATSYALVGVLSRKANEKNIADIFHYIGRMEKEYSVLFARDINKVKPELVKTAAYVEWAIKNKEVLI
jgi:hypothetical protein